MATEFAHRMDNPSNKRRKHSESTQITRKGEELGWRSLQSLLENDVLCAKVPSSEAALDLLAKWFQIIVDDQEKLRVFRQWITPSDDILPVVLTDIKKDIDEESEDDCPSAPTIAISDSDSSTTSNESTPSIPNTSTLPPSSTSSSTTTSSFHPPLSISAPPNKVTSIDFINNEIPITPRSTPQVLLLQQLLQQQQQQIVLLQKLQSNPDSKVGSLISSITLNPPSGSAGVLLTVTLKGGQWHPLSDTCNCTCGFTMMDGTVATSQRVAGGAENEMQFVVPPISISSDTSSLPLVVHLTSCLAPHQPLVCANSFMYRRERHSGTSSDDESDGTPDGSMCDEDGDDEGEGGENRPASSQTSPKQLMTIRERMVVFVQSTPKASARVVVTQLPHSRVVWKNRRLDTPFKVRVEGLGESPVKVSILALVVDHKGKLQIDAMENFEEECNPQGVTPFHNLRMTKGTWGKEWSITFVAVKGSTTNDPSIVAVSQACSVVVKTRKNPQVRNVNRVDPPSPISFVERKPSVPSRLKRNRVEDILDTSSTPLPPSTSTSTSSSASNSTPESHPSSNSSTASRLHTEAMSNLLYAAEIKHQEREFHVVRQPPSLPAPPSLPPTASPPRNNLMLPSIQSGFGSPEPNFANLQSLLGFLEDIKHKHHPKMAIIEQPQLKREGNVVIVKKGKPFRTPFRLQMRTAPQPSQRGDFHSAPDYNPQQYVCVAVLRNDKGEEVALKNSEVTFDARGLATFSGLMVMKGTWGKTVQLTFEARWGGAKKLGGGNNWPPLRMLVVAETTPLQLMCYTKDKKPANVG